MVGFTIAAIALTGAMLAKSILAGIAAAGVLLIVGTLLFALIQALTTQKHHKQMWIEHETFRNRTRDYDRRINENASHSHRL